MTLRGHPPQTPVDAGTGRELLRFVEHQLGRDPATIFGRSTLAVLARARPGDAVALELIIELFERGARMLERPDLGIAFGEWVTVRDLGPMAMLWEHYSTLADLLAAAGRYLPHENSGVMFRVERSGAEARIIYALMPELRRGAEQFMEATLVIGVKVLRNLLGPAWRPVGIEMQHPLLSSARRMHECFKAPVHPNSHDNAIVFAAADLHARHNPGDVALASLIERFLDERVSVRPVDFEADVKGTISWLLRSGNATLDEAAAALALGPRTLQRKLRLAGTDFATLLAAVRAEIAVAYLARGASQPIGELAVLLGYSEPSAVSRFLKQQFGHDGRSLRRRLRRN